MSEPKGVLEQAIEYERSRGKYRVVHWTGAPRRLERSVGRESVPGDRGGRLVRCQNYRLQPGSGP